MSRFESPSRWTPLLVKQRIDSILLADKELEISHEMQPKSLSAKNIAKNDYQWANAELCVVEEWAEKLFAAWLEIWEIQGLPKCHALYRAIYDYELQSLFGARRSVFEGALNMRRLSGQSKSNHTANGHHFIQEITAVRLTPNVQPTTY